MRRREAGVTLIELLIAVTLVALLAVGMLFAMRVGLNAMERANDRLMSNRKVVSVQRILEAQIAALMPITALCGTEGGGPAPKIPFFQGEPSTMRLASSYSMQEGARGYPRILEFQVIPGENNDGVRLVVNESLYTGPRSAGVSCVGEGPRFRPVLIGPDSFVLADKLAFCRLSFRESLPPPDLSRWVTRWIKPVLPNAIRVEMAPLHPEAAKLQLQTLTIPVRVTRYPMERYDF
jgi:prepilin-type N-terminal cleavage/methylation domain-containing protein